MISAARFFGGIKQSFGFVKLFDNKLSTLTTSRTRLMNLGFSALLVTAPTLGCMSVKPECENGKPLVIDSEEAILFDCPNPSSFRVINGGTVHFSSQYIKITTSLFEVDERSKIIVEALSCGPGDGANGSGGGDSAAGSGGAGGSHIGVGGIGGKSYGLIDSFGIEAGSCGGKGGGINDPAGYGGNAIEIVAANADLSGSILAEGENGGRGYYDDGGSSAYMVNISFPPISPEINL
ncbi:hypothetical protein HZC34_08155 [Candidatus Saganbacteria bacterium]|nr:hypothetical protein [Candidatus Saganbacteria bacterium]